MVPMPSPLKSPAVETPLLEVRNLHTSFFTPNGELEAVKGFNLVLHPREVYGLVGESGSGKSVTALSILQLIEPPGRILQGEILFQGTRLSDLSEQELVALRGGGISMILQQPLASLNPVFTIGTQLAELLEIHQGMDRQRARQRGTSLMEEAGLPEASKLAHSYPHQLSGGQAQRVLIAMALATRPKLLIADEPTSALDVTLQKDILNLMRGLTAELGTTILYITHDLQVIAEIADRVGVMYAGHLVEETGVHELFDSPLHPYTQGLLQSLPQAQDQDTPIQGIPGAPPDPLQLPPACRFAPRCQARIQHDLHICEERTPDLIPKAGKHQVRCWLYQEAPHHQAPLRSGFDHGGQA